MENNSNAIAEIQKKYAGCNLLMPAATEVQLNPFYKITVMEVTADLSENSGDIFKVGSVKTGTTQQGKDILEETYSPAKPLLMKIAAAAGIQFDPDHTYGTKIDANHNLEVNVVGSWLYESDLHGNPILGNILVIGEYWGGDGVEFCGMSDEQYNLLYPQLEELTKKAREYR